MSERVVIVGGGHAAGQCAASLRQKGWTGDVMIVGDENFPPYQRPPLSKAYLAGDLVRDRLFFRPREFYDKEAIELRLGDRVVEIDRANAIVRTERGENIDYDHLVLAAGARVRTLNYPGTELYGVGYLRSIADVDRLRKGFQGGASLTVVGAGYIGLEVAAVAAKHGLNVSVLEVADRVMARVTSPTVSRFFENLHRGHGVDVRLETGLDAFVGKGRVEAAVASDGAEVPCDMAVIGVGVIPNDELARDAGLDADDGVVVNEFTATSDPNIYAIGDCTRHPSRYYGGMLRLESVHNALEQAKTAAAAICGAPAPYDQAPWFWSDQYDVKLQTVGICAGRFDEDVVRGDPANKKFSVFYLKDDVLVAVDSINAPADHMLSRKLIEARCKVSGADLANEEFDLKSLL